MTVMRKRIAGLGIALVALGAASGAWTTASAQQDAEQSKALFTLLIDRVFNAGDLALADWLVAKNVTNDGSRIGRDAFKAMLAAGRRQDPDRHLLVDDIGTQDDLVIGRVTPVGRPVSESRVVILRVRDSQVVEYWSLADEPALGRQLGLRAGPATQPPASAN
jgi:predicted ester cyclase